MLAGDDLHEVIDRGVKLWDKTLLCCSESSLTSWWVDNEIDTALDKERRLKKERNKTVLALIPLNLDGHLFSEGWEDGKKVQITKRFAPSFEGWETNNSLFEEALENVIKALQTDNTGREAPPLSKL